MSLLRNDGEYKIYVIEKWFPTGVTGRKEDAEWSGVNFDEHLAGFSASGPCWQETAVHGTYDFDEAVSGLNQVALEHPGEKFRLRLVTVSQHAETVAEMSIK